MSLQILGCILCVIGGFIAGAVTVIWLISRGMQEGMRK